MSYMKKVGMAVLYGISNGTLFYIIGGVANSVLSSITTEVAAILGFVTAAGIAVGNAVKDDKE